MKLSVLKTLSLQASHIPEDQLQQWLFEQLRSQGLDPGNLYQELEMTSAYVDTHRDVSYGNNNMQLHSHAFYELLYCRTSCGVEYLVGSERYKLQEGDILFVAPGISHRPLLPEYMEVPYKRYVLWLSPAFMDQYGTMLGEHFTDKLINAHLLRTKGTRWEHLVQLFHLGIQEAEQQSRGWEAAVIGNTITLLTQISRAMEDRAAKAPAVENPDLLDRIMAYVEKNYAAPITIAGLSKQFFVSSSTVSHLFKEKLGVSFYRYITQRRLITAKSLIAQGLLLEDVATQTGFQDYSGFYRAFRQEYGISPRQYRSTYCN